MTNLPPELQHLSIQERIDLAHALWESIPHPPAAYLTEEKLKELERRELDLEANPNSGTPWEVVRARIQAKLDSSRISQS